MVTVRVAAFALVGWVVIQGPMSAAFVPTSPAYAYPYPNGRPGQLDYMPLMSAKGKIRSIFSRGNKDGANGNVNGDFEAPKRSNSSLFPAHQGKQMTKNGRKKPKTTLMSANSTGAEIKNVSEAKKISKKPIEKSKTEPNAVTDSRKNPVTNAAPSIPTLVTPKKAEPMSEFFPKKVKSQPVDDTTVYSFDEANGTPPKSKKSATKKLGEMSEIFHRRAQRATANRYYSETKVKSLLCSLKIYGFYMLHLAVHVAKSSVMLLPPLFAVVFRKMQLAVSGCNEALLLEDGVGGKSGGLTVKTELQRQREEQTAVEDGSDVEGALKMSSFYVQWTTKLTVAVVSTVITSSYALGGAVHVATRFIRALLKTKSLTKSFESAADQAALNEDRWTSILQTVNGEQD